jgi:prolyl 4-hydroxylase
VIPEREAPPDLREQQRAMQAAAPDWGLGFEKSRLSDDLAQRLLDHLRGNAAYCRVEHPIREIGNDNPQIIPTLILSDDHFNQQLAAELKAAHEAWSGLRLQYSSCYGIRIYQRGTYLYTHVDRPTHVVSSAICVDAALDEPWPLSLVDAGGQRVQVDLAPGECLFYEGARLAHGRPYPLKGDYYAAIFMHYHPIPVAAPTV